jgi:hypothetical protein
MLASVYPKFDSKNNILTKKLIDVNLQSIPQAKLI